MPTKHSGLHQYLRTNLGKNRDYVVYKCTRAGCTHYLAEAMMVGATFLCECGEKGTVESKEQLTKTLRCSNCRTNADVPAEEVLKVLEKVEPE
jgi:hypothetical protein